MADDDDEPSLGNRFDAAATDTGDTRNQGESEDLGGQDSRHGTDGTDDTHAPYGASRTYYTPEGFALKRIDDTSVRDGADREFYIPQELLDEIDLAFDTLNLRYRREHGRSLNKHPHWYNRLLVIGLATIGDVSERDIDDLVEELSLPTGADAD